MGNIALHRNINQEINKKNLDHEYLKQVLFGKKSQPEGDFNTPKIDDL